jgi:tetratricopeptide (TPR) repeat protein
LGNLDEADDHYRKAVILSNSNPEFQRKYVDFLIRYNKDLRSVALPAARQVFYSNSDNPESIVLIARVFLQLGDLLTAERFLWKALDREPDYFPAYNHLNQIYYLQGKPTLVESLPPETLSIESEFYPFNSLNSFHDQQDTP